MNRLQTPPPQIRQSLASLRELRIFIHLSSDATIQNAPGGGIILTEPLRMQMIELRCRQMEERAAAAESQKATAFSSPDLPSPNSDRRATNPDLRTPPCSITFPGPYEALIKEMAANGGALIPPPESTPLIRRMYDCPDPQPVRVKSTMNKACS